MEKNFFKTAFDLGSWNSQAQWPNFGSHFRPSGPPCHSTDRGLHSCSTAPEPFTAAFLHTFQEALLPAFQRRLSSYADSQFSAHCSKSREFLPLSCSTRTATTSWQLKLPSFLPFSLALSLFLPMLRGASSALMIWTKLYTRPGHHPTVLQIKLRFKPIPCLSRNECELDHFSFPATAALPLPWLLCFPPLLLHPSSDPEAWDTHVFTIHHIWNSSIALVHLQAWSDTPENSSIAFSRHSSAATKRNIV